MTTADLAATVDRMEQHAIAVRLAEFGRQLAVAAAIQRGWENGADECSGWYPGCREEMP